MAWRNSYDGYHQDDWHDFSPDQPWQQECQYFSPQDSMPHQQDGYRNFSPNQYVHRPGKSYTPYKSPKYLPSTQFENNGVWPQVSPYHYNRANYNTAKPLNQNSYRTSVPTTANKHLSSVPPKTNKPLPSVPATDSSHNEAWPPSVSIGSDYQGPYPIRDLENARSALITCLTEPCSVYSVLARVKEKLNITMSKKKGTCYTVTATTCPHQASQPTTDVNTSIGIKPSTAIATKTGIKPSTAIATKTGTQPSTALATKTGIKPSTAMATNSSTSAAANTCHTKYQGASHHMSWRAAPSSSATVTSPETTTSLPTEQSTSLPTEPQGFTKAFCDGEDASPENLWGEILTTFVSGNKRKLTEEEGENHASKKLKLMKCETELMFKCDLCKFFCPQIKALKTHLMSTKHYSGSLYNVQSPQGVLEVVSVENMLVETNKCGMSMMNSGLVVVCPDCSEIFQDIFMCGIHHKYKHGSLQGKYSLCPIIKSEMVSFLAEPHCITCDTDFGSNYKLHNHWRNDISHVFSNSKQNVDSIFVFCCPYCPRIFHSCFFICKNHVLAKHKHMEKDRYAVVLKQILMPKIKLELPPLQTEDGGEDGYQKELKILFQTVDYFRKFRNSSQSSRTKMKQEIKQLASHLGNKSTLGSTCSKKTKNANRKKKRKKRQANKMHCPGYSHLA